MNPSCSQYNPLIRSLRLPQNRNSAFVNGSSSNSCCTMAARPSIPFRRSVYPQAMYTRSAPAKSLSMENRLTKRGGEFGACSGVHIQGCSADPHGRDKVFSLGQCRQFHKSALRRLRCYLHLQFLLFDHRGKHFLLPEVICFPVDPMLLTPAAHRYATAPAICHPAAPFQQALLLPRSSDR